MTQERHQRTHIPTHTHQQTNDVRTYDSPHVCTYVVGEDILRGMQSYCYYYCLCPMQSFQYQNKSWGRAADQKTHEMQIPPLLLDITMQQIQSRVFFSRAAMHTQGSVGRRYGLSNPSSR
jgi:hypothetical protein